jgi:hypothetical protein
LMSLQPNMFCGTMLFIILPRPFTLVSVLRLLLFSFLFLLFRVKCLLACLFVR